jgi:hypothetical protein
LVFAPLPTIALKRIGPAMAGAASGVLNTTRQLGFAIAAGVIGAVLQSQLSTALHDRAVTDSVTLSGSVRKHFIASFANAAKAGFALGPAQSGGAQLPGGLPAATKAQLVALAHDVFVNAYVTALGPTLAMAVAVLLIAAFATFSINNRRAIKQQTLPISRPSPAPEQEGRAMAMGGTIWKR